MTSIGHNELSHIYRCGWGTALISQCITLLPVHCNFKYAMDTFENYIHCLGDTTWITNDVNRWQRNNEITRKRHKNIKLRLVKYLHHMKNDAYKYLVLFEWRRIYAPLNCNSISSDDSFRPPRLTGTLPGSMLIPWKFDIHQEAESHYEYIHSENLDSKITSAQCGHFFQISVTNNC